MLIPEHPDRQGERGAEKAAVRSDSQPPRGHLSVILVADDNVLFRNLIGLAMQQDGHFVLSAADGHEGLELSRHYQGTIDLIIADVQMPRLNGTDLCGHLLEERPGIKLLVMSSADMSEVARQAINVPFLHKPFDATTLRAKVQPILAAPRRHPDLTTLLANLHSELQEINREIFSLEQSAKANKRAVPGLMTDDPDPVS